MKAVDAPLRLDALRRLGTLEKEGRGGGGKNGKVYQLIFLGRKKTLAVQKHDFHETFMKITCLWHCYVTHCKFFPGYV